MSKVGKTPVSLPEGVTVTITGKTVVVKGPKGELTLTLPASVGVEQADGELRLTSRMATKAQTAVYGTYRALLQNMVTGVTTGWSKTLEIVGTGYRAEVQNGALVLTIGYSHPVTIPSQEGISFKVEKNDVTVEGVDRQAVGQVAANIRAVRPPEPYKGKGIKYKNEQIRRKAGKAAKGAGE